MTRFLPLLLLLLSPVASSPEDKLDSALEAGWKGKKVCELLYEDGQKRALRCTFPPGVGHERHFHPAHFGYILSGGTMRITDAGGERVSGSPASTNATWQSDGVTWHEAVNIGDTTAIYLIIEQK